MCSTISILLYHLLSYDQSESEAYICIKCNNFRGSRIFILILGTEKLLQKNINPYTIHTAVSCFIRTYNINKKELRNIHRICKIFCGTALKGECTSCKFKHISCNLLYQQPRYHINFFGITSQYYFTDFYSLQFEILVHKLF